MNVRLKYVTLGVVAAVALTGGTYGLARNHSSSDRQSMPVPPTPAPFILAADSHGSVVFDLERNVIIGYDRAGKSVWQDAAMAKSAYVTCVATCPNVVASGSLLDQNTVGEPRIVRSGAAVTTRANQNGVILLEKEPGTRVELDLQAANPAIISYQKGKQTQRFALPGPGMPQINPGPGGALAVVSRSSSGTATFVVARRSAGWKITPVPDRTAQVGCAGPDVHAVASAERATFVDELSGHTVVLDQPHIGACHVAGTSLLAETMSTGPAGRNSVVRYWDVRKGTGWTVNSADSVSSDLDPTGTKAVVVQGHVATIRTAEDQQAVDGVVGARYAEDGSLVLLHPDATVSRR
ncbi:hypothetical protein [Actinoplanes sp. NPDC049316]|uniref:hypothetical protein n=1 Tax=Actinoplanes sp. NPDC049316 TaxID=3154727 RepID=UPI00343A7DB3